MAFDVDQHRAYKAAYARQWRARNRDKVNEQVRARRPLNRDKLNDQARTKRATNQYKTTQHKWRVLNKEKLIAWNFHSTMSLRARKRGVPFALTVNMIAHMLEATKVCPILGIPLVRGKGVGGATGNSPSFDCFYPELGYVPGNVHVISKRANCIKQDASAEEIHAVATWMERTERALFQ